jgi:uncharacterized membrane-anchored protein
MNIHIENDKGARRPVIDPLLLALTSRRVLIALAALLVGLAVAWIPALAAVQGELLTLVTALALALIGGLSLEDAARAGRSTQLPADRETLVRAVVVDVVEAVLAAREGDDEA